MAKVGFGDLVALAKSGWTPEQVNNTLDRLEKINESNEGDSGDNNPDDNNSSGPDNDDSNDDEPDNNDEGSNDEPDEKDKRIAELEEQLKKAQKANVHQNNDSGEKKELDDLVDDIFKEFFD